MLGTVRAAQDGFDLCLLVGGQSILGQQVCVALNDGQRRFQVMRQRGDLFGALLLHPPLALQAVGQLSAHRLHGMQRGGKLSQTCAVCVNALGLLRSDGIHCAVQTGGLGGKDPHGAVGLPAQPCDDQQRQQKQVAGLEIRQRVPQCRVGVGHNIVVL